MYTRLLGDFPWSYDDEGTGGSQSSSAVTKYPTLSIDDLMKLPIHSVMGPNFAAFLWITAPLKYQYGPRLLHAYGLTYRTTVYWHKTGRLGMGHWFRGCVEELIVATHGEVPAFKCQMPNIIQHPGQWRQPNGEPSEHSQKPDVFHDLIERATGEASSRRNLELFARREKPGWRTMGGDLGGLDIREEIRREAMRMHGQGKVDSTGSPAEGDHGRSAGHAAGDAAGRSLAGGGPVGVC